MALNFDPKRTPFPKYRNRYALAKIDGTGQDDFGPRVLRGNVWHRGLTGSQTLDGAVDYLISPTTAGLTDGYIDNRTGEVVMMNPIGALFDDIPAWWEDRAGWANGVYGKGRAPSADAAAFVARFGSGIGANIINQDLESWEILGNYDSPISEACKATMVQIAANRAQTMQIPYDRWPLNPATGTVVHFGHCEFTLKECPGPVVWAFINGEMVTRVREVLRVAQTGSVTAPIPAPQPTPAPARPVQTGPIDAGMAAWFFGRAVGDDGLVYQYSPNGIVSREWLKRGNATGRYPELVAVFTPDERKLFHFSDGSVLVQANPRSGVTYIGGDKAA